MDKSKKLSSELRERLLSLKIGFSPYLEVIVRDINVQIGIKANPEQAKKGYVFAWGSDIDVYIHIRKNTSSEINFGCTGAFTPYDNKAAYWRTIHAAIVLQNWETVMALCAEYAEKYRNQ